MANRLAAESSPYLRQHAENPVDWYPWGDDAFARAKAEDRPILLSIGYSACHWCHVMERESFDDPAIAAQMNRLFVSVKVDREERPDLDQIYQLVVQMMGRNGGWPLTVFLTPDRRPFFGGTYFPPAERHGMPGLPTVLTAVHDAWRDRRRELETTASTIAADIEKITSARSEAGDVPADAARIAARKLAQRFDEANGGFGDRPKFPNTMALEVMLRAGHAGDDASLARARKALDAMRAGGIWDHLGGGFHRYSTDARWLVPHFEKMLYDNALLLRLYADALRAGGGAREASTIRGIVGWLEREMRSPEGAFYATQDADSEGAEGKFFVWRPEELDAVLADEESAVARLCFGVSPTGNFEETGASVLHENRPVAMAARQLGLDEARAEAALARARAALFAAREARPRPFRDEKVIATWNGLMIGALAEAGAALGDEHLVGLARTALGAVRARLWSAEEKSLRRIWIDGAARIPAFLEDHADLAGAAIDVHEAADDRDALGWARELAEAAIARFWVEEDGAFLFAPRDATDLIARTRDAYDHAVPSGTSSMVHALLRLASHLGVERYAAIAERVLRAHARAALEQPLGYGHMVCAMDRFARGATEVIVVADRDDPAGRELLATARRAWIPSRVLARIDPGASSGPPLLEGKGQLEGRATAYVCRGRTCSAPVTTSEALAALLAEREAR